MFKKSLFAIFSLCVVCFLGGCNATDSAAPAKGNEAPAESSAAPADGLVVKGNVAQVISKLEEFEESGAECSGAEVTDKIADISWIDNENGGLLAITLSADAEIFSSTGYASCLCSDAETMQTYAELNVGDTVTIYGEAFLFDDGRLHLEMVDCDVLDNN